MVYSDNYTRVGNNRKDMDSDVDIMSLGQGMTITKTYKAIETECPKNYVPIDWEAYLEQIHKDHVKKFWAQPMILPITAMFALVYVICEEIIKVIK